MDFNFSDPPTWVVVYGWVAFFGFVVALVSFVAAVVGILNAAIRHHSISRWMKVCLAVAVAYGILLPISLAIVSNVNW